MAVKKFKPPKKSNKTTFDISELEREKREKYVSGDDPKRLEWLKDTLDYCYFGIIKK